MYKDKMLSVKGIIQDGVAQPNEPVKRREGQAVMITFLEENRVFDEPTREEEWSEEDWREEDWDRFEQIIEEYQMDTGIEDFAYQHDHYIHGTPKKTTQL
jgi:hypothetical protein